MTPVVWTVSALADLEAIQTYVARDSARYSEALVDQILGAVEQIELFPRSGRVVPEFMSESI